MYNIRFYNKNLIYISIGMLNLYSEVIKHFYENENNYVDVNSFPISGVDWYSPNYVFNVCN